MTAIPDTSKLVPGHVEGWAPVLLRALIDHGSDTVKLFRPEDSYLKWANARRLSVNDYTPLLGAGSWNHSIMSQACLAWMGDGNAIEWICTLLEYQLGIKTPPDNQSILAMFGGTETLSCEYEMFRAGAYCSLGLLAKRFPDHSQSARVTALVSRYCATLARLLDLSCTSWRDESQFKGAAGPWYTGLMISPVGERSAVGHFQNDMGPFMSYVQRVVFTSKREDWPMGVVRELALSATGPAATIKLWAPMHWQRYSDGSVVTWKDSRQNGNTTCVMWSIADASTHTMQLGYPWGDGRQGARHSDGAGSCAIEGNRIVARNGDIVSAGTLPSGDIVSRYRGDSTGITKEI